MKMEEIVTSLKTRMNTTAVTVHIIDIFPMLHIKFSVQIMNIATKKKAQAYLLRVEHRNPSRLTEIPFLNFEFKQKTIKSKRKSSVFLKLQKVARKSLILNVSTLHDNKTNKLICTSIINNPADSHPMDPLILRT